MTLFVAAIFCLFLTALIKLKVVLKEEIKLLINPVILKNLGFGKSKIISVLSVNNNLDLRAEYILYDGLHLVCAG
tara:strand:+ start:291 stop:515 length:225 start_codon:yes stop_codon:yes gene_type:complete